jgi:HSP20 family protein
MFWNTNDPFRELEKLQSEINRYFGGPLAGDRPGASWRTLAPGFSARMYPPLNLRQEADNVVVEALAPGIDPESFKVSVVQNQHGIEGEKTAGAPEGIKPEAYHRNERGAGRFIRTLQLPVEIDADGVKATYRRGVLTVTLPKSHAARTRQIAVSVA